MSARTVCVSTAPSSVWRGPEATKANGKQRNHVPLGASLPLTASGATPVEELSLLET